MGTGNKTVDQQTLETEVFLKGVKETIKSIFTACNKENEVQKISWLEDVTASMIAARACLHHPQEQNVNFTH